MKKNILCTLLVATFLPMSSFAAGKAPQYYSCVAQILKNDTAEQPASAIIGCGLDTISVETIKPLAQQSAAEVTALKSAMVEKVKSVLNAETPQCTEHDTEILWLTICHQ